MHELSDLINNGENDDWNNVQKVTSQRDKEIVNKYFEKTDENTMIKYIMRCLAHKFQHGMVFTSTLFTSSYSYLPSKVVSFFNMNKLKRFIKYQKQQVIKNNNVVAFLILDDIVGCINFNDKIWSMLFT